MRVTASSTPDLPTAVQSVGMSSTLATCCPTSSEEWEGQSCAAVGVKAQGSCTNASSQATTYVKPVRTWEAWWTAGRVPAQALASTPSLEWVHSLLNVGNQWGNYWMRLKSGKFAFLDCLSGATNWRDNYVGSGEFSKSPEKNCGKKIGAVDPS